MENRDNLHAIFIKNVERIVELMYDAFEAGLKTSINLEFEFSVLKKCEQAVDYPKDTNEQILRNDLGNGYFQILMQDGKVSGFRKKENFKPLV